MIIKELVLREYPYKNKRGLSERLAKKYLEKKGYYVVRGRRVLGKGNSTNYYLFPNVRNMYDKIEKILEKKLDLSLKYFRKIITN